MELVLLFGSSAFTDKMDGYVDYLLFLVCAVKSRKARETSPHSNS